MLAHPVVAAVSGRRRRSEIDATIYVPPYRDGPSRLTAASPPQPHAWSAGPPCRGRTADVGSQAYP
jgi:hypothetical protein